MGKAIIISSVILGKRGSIGERFEYIVESLQKSSKFEEVHFVGKSHTIKTDCVITRLPTYFLFFAALKRVEKRFGVKLHARSIELMFFSRWVNMFCNKYVSSCDVILSQELIPIRNFKVFYDISILPECLVEEFICVQKRVNCKGTVNRVMLGRLLQNAKGAFVPSKYINERINGLSVKNRLFLVPFAGMKYEFDLLDTNDGKNIYFFGDLSLRKGIDKLFELADILESEKWIIHLYGRPSRYYNDLKRMSDISNIRFHGHQTLELEKFSAGYYVFPSYLEGSSKSLYDAMNIGFPILTSPMSGVPSEVLGDYCFEMDTFDMSVWAAQLIELHNMQRHLDFTKIREMGSNFTWSRYAASVIKALENDFDY